MCYDQAHFRNISLQTSVEDGLGKIDSRMPVRCWNVSSRHSMEREDCGDEKIRRGVHLKRPFNIRGDSTPTQPSRCLFGYLFLQEVSIWAGLDPLLSGLRASCFPVSYHYYTARSSHQCWWHLLNALCVLGILLVFNDEYVHLYKTETPKRVARARTIPPIWAVQE